MFCNRFLAKDCIQIDLINVAKIGTLYTIDTDLIFKIKK